METACLQLHSAQIPPTAARAMQPAPPAVKSPPAVTARASRVVMPVVASAPAQQTAVEKHTGKQTASEASAQPSALPRLSSLSSCIGKKSSAANRLRARIEDVRVTSEADFFF